MTWFVLIVVLCVVAFVVIRNSNTAADALEKAKAAYHQALAQLKANPTSPDLKQHALLLGRQYANLTRNSKGVTTFDEVALANDISAATAAASLPSRPTPAVVVSADIIEARIASLDALRAKGIVTEEEYTERRRKLLDEL